MRPPKIRRSHHRHDWKNHIPRPHTPVNSLPPPPQRLGSFPREFRIPQPHSHQMSPVHPISPFQTSNLNPRKKREEYGRETHCFPTVSLNPSLAWKILKLLISCRSPFRNPIATLLFCAVKCRASSASACASVIAGISFDRGCAPCPVNERRVYWMIMRSGVVGVAGWWCKSGRRVKRCVDLPNLCPFRYQ